MFLESHTSAVSVTCLYSNKAFHYVCTLNILTLKVVSSRASMQDFFSSLEQMEMSSSFVFRLQHAAVG